MTAVKEATFELLRRHGLTTIFGNPGSNELPFFARLPSDFRYVLDLKALRAEPILKLTPFIEQMDPMRNAAARSTHLTGHEAAHRSDRPGPRPRSSEPTLRLCPRRWLLLEYPTDAFAAFSCRRLLRTLPGRYPALQWCRAIKPDPDGTRRDPRRAAPGELRPPANGFASARAAARRRRRDVVRQPTGVLRMHRRKRAPQPSGQHCRIQIRRRRGAGHV